MLKDLKEVISKPIIAVGEINPDNLAEHLKVAVGVGEG